MLTSGEYSLSKKNVVEEKKSMLFVKLTDSAQRALNDYFRNRNNTEVPFIEFNKNEGRILIPTCPKGNVDSDKYMAQFKFDVTSNMAMQGTQGRFDCVQHKRGTKQLIKSGQLTQRLIIHASEDVYETTKNRMAAIELAQRKNCTRQLDWNSNTQINRKVRIDRNFKGSFNKSTTLTKPEEKETKIAPVPEISNMIRSRSRPTHNPPPQKACISRKPLKDRLIHMLAVRPYKKPELIAVLQREGLRDSDRTHLTDTLMSVSVLRDNAYYLAKHAWNDIQEDWPFYSEQEKQLIKKNKLRNLTSPSSSDSGISVSSNHSPNNISNGDNSPPSRYKRPGYVNGVDGFPTKRQRISHFVRQEPATAVKPAIVFEDNAQLPQSRLDDCAKPVTNTSSPSTLSEKPLPQKSFQRSTSDNRPISYPELDSFSPSKEASAVIVSSTEISSTSDGLENEENVSVNSLPPVPIEYNRKTEECPFIPPASVTSQQSLSNRRHLSEKPKYMKEYVTITSPEQRRRYKTDFKEIFKEYLRVHEEVDAVSNTFAQLGESLRQQPKGTPKYRKIEAEIFKKYYALKQSPKFEAAKRRFEYLHEKLSHIKNLVHEYDEKNLK